MGTTVSAVPWVCRRLTGDAHASGSGSQKPPEAGLKAEPNRRKALFPGRSCFPLSPQDGDGKSGV